MKIFTAILLLATVSATAANEAEQLRIKRPKDGEHHLRVLDQRTLELQIVTRKSKLKPLPYWDVVDDDGIRKMPASGEFKVKVNGEPAAASVIKIGFRRRPVYAPLGEHDLRVGSQIYLLLSADLGMNDGDEVEVILPSDLKSPPGVKFATTFQTRRWSPAIHVNQVGYQTGFNKQAFAGYYLGDAGELPLKDAKLFYLRDAETGKKVFSGAVKHIRDIGFPFAEAQYQRVFTLDFSKFDEPGRYVLGIGSLGESYPFVIGDGLFANIARTYALGLYHQRSGAGLEFPFTRFTRGPSHTRAIKIPDEDDETANSLVDGMIDKPHEDQKAPELRGYATSLYPIIKKGSIDVRGGHHDAGDYSKYTTNCAQLINHLMFAYDALPGVSEIDNLGLPESGDGIGDLLQIALHEAKFLAELQDEDGGFFFLVYPDDRKYEDDIAPDEAGGQIVFPKNTASTAAAVAALAQIGGSPNLQEIDKSTAAIFLRKAEAGWRFLENAWEKHGRDGAYQRVSHYGDIFMDRDEIVWAATELYLATKNKKYHEFLLKNYRPGAPETRRWGWQKLFEGYGGAARSYAYARMAGRAGVSDLDPGHFRACQQEVWGWGADLRKYADESAYALSFPSESKAFRAAGWYFPISDTLDLVAASAQSNSKELDRTILSNMNYELGANPTNTCFLTGLGYKRRFEIVHQWARNDDFILPMSGIPVGSLVAGVPWIGTYESEMGGTIYPSDGDPKSPYAFYDRITDTFDVSSEFVTYQQGRALAAAAYMMARTKLAKQPYTHLDSKITGAPRQVAMGERIELGFELTEAEGLDLSDALIVWEARGLADPHCGESLSLLPNVSGPNWATVEAQWPDGRRAFARVEFAVTAGNAADPLKPGDSTSFYFSGDSPGLRPGMALRAGRARTHHQEKITVSTAGEPKIDDRNLLWMNSPAGGAIRFNGFEDKVGFEWEQSPSIGIEISGWFYFEKLPHAELTGNLFGIGPDAENQTISLQFDKWAKPIAPQLTIAESTAVDAENLGRAIGTNRWHKILISAGANSWKIEIDGKETASGTVSDTERASSFFEGTTRHFAIGHFIGIADELHVREVTTSE